jgi:hypothetical protein
MSPTEFAKAVEEHCQLWERIAYSTTPAKRQQVELAAKEFYVCELKSDPPKCHWLESPAQSRKYFWKSDQDFDMHRKIRAIVAAAVQRLPVRPELTAAIEQIRHPYLAWREGWSPWRWGKCPTEGDHDDLRPYALIDFFASRMPQNSRLAKDLRSVKEWLFLIASCNGIWILEGTLVFMDTPDIVRTDDRGRLHDEEGPALRYRDGAEYYFLHGIRVPKKYGLTQAGEINLPDVLAQPNAEVRLALISKIGFARLLGTVRHWTISEADGNRLIEFRVKGTQLVRGLHVKWRDKTGEKETVIPVPNKRAYFGNDVPDDIDDCEQVRRWTLGWPKEALAVAET